MLGKIVKEIADSMSVDNYYSLGDRYEFNNDIDDNSVFPVILLVNEYTATHTLKRNRVFEDVTYPIEILFLDVVRHDKTGEDVSFDPTGQQLQNVYDNMTALAQEFMVRLSKRKEFTDGNGENIEATLTNVNHLFDSQLSGILFTANVPLAITYDYCIAEC